MLMVLVGQYFVAELIAASAWVDPSYSWTHNYISALGATECGPDICSPRAIVVQVSLVVHAGLALAAMTLLSRLVIVRTVRVGLQAMTVAHAAGNLIVAFSPLSPVTGPDDLHYVGAAIGMSAGVVMVGLVGGVFAAGPVRRPAYAAFTLCCSTIALCGLLLTRWNATRDVGLPSGLLERAAVDPIVVWFVVTGVCLGTPALIRAVRSLLPAGGRA